MNDGEGLLSNSHTTILHAVLEHVRQSRGNTAPRILFTGGSEEVKALAAEGLANKLKLELFRVDLDAIVSKYIGETEKNLHRLFESARETRAILFFDEADALFGKRTKMRDSHDRFANLETNYLLQRIENYEGVAILATNHKERIDEAFIRHFRFVVDFC